MIPHLPGYLFLMIGAGCYVAGVISPAWQEVPWVAIGSTTIKFWIGPWWYCQYLDQMMDWPKCSSIQIVDPISSDQMALLVLTSLSTLLFLVAFVIGSTLVCCFRSPGAASNWMIVSMLAMFAGMTGLGSVITFAMTQTTNNYIFGFHLAMAGAYIGVFSSLLIAKVPRTYNNSKSQIRHHASF